MRQSMKAQINKGDATMKGQNIQINLTTSKKEKPAPDQLEFGKVFTDHMFIADYTEGKGWHDKRIVPYAPLTLDPSAMIFHYGQTVFEGLKADRKSTRLNSSHVAISY